MRCGVQAQAENAAFPAAGGNGTLRITTNRECAWAATSDADWLGLASPANGQGDGTIRFTVTDNSAPSSRAAAITVNDQRLPISQDGRPCEYRVSTTAQSFGAAGGEGRIEVAASNAACAWQAVTDTPWIAIVGGRDGSGNGAVTFQVAAGSGPARSGSVTVAGQQVIVQQNVGCSYALGGAAFNVGAEGGVIDVPVMTAPGCPWSATSTVDWIAIAAGAGGSGPGGVRLIVAPSPGPTRSAAVRIAGIDAAITQGAGCSVAVSPASVSVTERGASGSIAVDAAPGCEWVASASAPWITIGAGGHGSGAGRVDFAVAANSGPQRAASLTIGNRTVAVTQADGCAFSFSPSTQNVPSSGGPGQVAVEGAAGCQWSADVTAPWITITAGARGVGPGRIDFNVAANSGPQRRGSVTIGDRAFTVTQASGCAYTITPSSQEVANSGGSGIVGVSTAAGCPWTAASAVEWTTVTPASGSGPGQVQFTSVANASPARSGTLTIAGQTFTITQASLCTYSFTPPSHAFGADGGNGNILVIVSGACSWTATTATPWITITAGTSGVGNGLVQFVAAPNPGPARTGSLTIAGINYTVTEAAR
ncbi:MAG TPA: BACON domain-containing carbohydrate-binding protein [Vicinamibacterales bacterium]|nr:BACON domain-containing carbohydrate-binding protein [Vicinamibacterales bacterium]